jgi:hypothetical protein
MSHPWAKPKPDSGNVVPIRNDESRELHPYAAKAIAAELGRLDALPRPWRDGAQWDDTTFQVACNLLEFANSPWSGYRRDTAEADLFAHAPRDEAWGVRQHEQKWRSAEAAVGAQGRPEPAANDSYEPRVYEVPASTLIVEEATDEPPSASWKELDLGPYLDGTHEPVQPTLMVRSDGPALIYPGLIHSLHGESESGKSLVAQAEAVRQINEGCDVAYIDFESDAASVVTRLLELGARHDAIRDHLHYARPEVDPRAFDYERRAFTRLLAKPIVLAVIDGVTEALGIFGASTKDNDEITAFMRLLPRTITRRTGAAVVLIDHVTKDSDSRGRFAIGGQAKMAALDGAAYVVEVTEALGRGRRGMIVLRVAKDRPGGVRAHAGEFRKGDRTQEAARITVDSTQADGLIHIAVDPPLDPLVQAAEFRPTVLMEQISQIFAEEPGLRLSKNKVENLVNGRRETIRKALDLLEHEHYIRIEDGPRNTRVVSSIQPYRQVLDPKSEAYNQVSEVTSPDFAPTSPGRSESDLAPALPPYGAGRGQETPAGTSTSPASTEPAEDVACRRCFRPVDTTIVVGGMCPRCATENGVQS